MYNFHLSVGIWKNVIFCRFLGLRSSDFCHFCYFGGQKLSKNGNFEVLTLEWRIYINPCHKPIASPFRSKFGVKIVFSCKFCVKIYFCHFCYFCIFWGLLKWKIYIEACHKPIFRPFGLKSCIFQKIFLNLSLGILKTIFLPDF